MRGQSSERVHGMTLLAFRRVATGFGRHHRPGCHSAKLQIPNCPSHGLELLSRDLLLFTRPAFDSMALIGLLTSPWAVVLAAAAVVGFYILPYIGTYGQLRGIPAPFGAQFTNLWLLATCRQGNRYEVVDKAHKKLGPLVRIAPNHVSVADAEAIQTIYGHGNGFLKS